MVAAGGFLEPERAEHLALSVQVFWLPGFWTPYPTKSFRYPGPSTAGVNVIGLRTCLAHDS